MTRILLLDDSQTDVQAIARLLRREPDVDFRHVSNVADALQRLRDDPPEMVLVDPAITESAESRFLTEAREVAPYTPILVVSAHGHEAQAVRALRRGATSFVPKHLIEEHLVDTMRAVLQVASQEQRQMRMMELMTDLHCKFVIDNDAALIAPLVGYLQDHMARMEICEASDLTRVGIAVHEALTNAMFHGNLELSSCLREQESDYAAFCECRRQESPYCDRKVHVTLALDNGCAEITVRDEGPGFDPEHLPDPTDLANVDKVSGRGVFLIRTFMDAVEFNDKGNEIRMRKERRAMVSLG